MAWQSLGKRILLFQVHKVYVVISQIDRSASILRSDCLPKSGDLLNYPMQILECMV